MSDLVNMKNEVEFDWVITKLNQKLINMWANQRNAWSNKTGNKISKKTPPVSANLIVFLGHFHFVLDVRNGLDI